MLTIEMWKTTYQEIKGFEYLNHKESYQLEEFLMACFVTPIYIVIDIIFCVPELLFIIYKNLVLTKNKKCRR